MTTILIIEDDEDIRTEIVDMLHLEGYETIEASDGVTGLQSAFAHTPDMILCDVIMPRIDGYEVLLQIRLNPKTWLTPFVFLTAKSEHEDLRRGMNLGADDYLAKPFDYKELIKTVQARLDKQHLLEITRQEEANTLQSLVLTSLPQEIQIPLTVITEHVSILRKLQPKSPTKTLQTRILDSIEQATAQLHRISENYLLRMQLEMLRRDNGRVNQLRQLSTPAPSMYITDIAQERAGHFHRTSNLEINLQDQSIQITAKHLQKLVYELTDNAFKFSPVDSTVHVKSESSDKEYILRISNKGGSLTQKDIENLDESLLHAQSNNSQGFGFGLLLSKQICELYGGALNIERERGGETTVSVTLPTTYQSI